MPSLSHRILFPVSDCLEADANSLAGVRRRLLERNVGAGDLLVVTNTYRSGDYVDHEGKPRDIYDFDRKFFINHDTLFTVKQVVDEGDRLVLSVVEYPVGVDGGCHFSSVGALVDGRFLVHVSRSESELVGRVCGVWDVQENLVRVVNRCLPVVRGGLLPPHQDLRVSVVCGLGQVVGRDVGLVGRLEAPVVEGYDAVLGRMGFVLDKYRRYVGVVERAADGNFGLPPVCSGSDCSLTLADGTVLCEGCFVGTRFDYYKRASRWLPATDPRYVFVSQVVSVDSVGRSAVLALDTGDEATLTLGEGGEVSVWYDEREYRLLSPLTVARGVTFAEANEYVVSKYQAESRRGHLAKLDGDRFVRELTSIGHPVPAELVEFLPQLRTVGDGVETAYKKARAAVLKQKRAKVKEVASVVFRHHQHPTLLTQTALHA